MGQKPEFLMVFDGVLAFLNLCVCVFSVAFNVSVCFCECFFSGFYSICF